MEFRGYSYEGNIVDFKYTPTVREVEFKDKVFSALKLIYDNELCGIKFVHCGTKVEVSFDGKLFLIEEEKNNTYNITINTQGSDNKSAHEFAETFIKAIKEKGGNL